MKFLRPKLYVHRDHTLSGGTVYKESQNGHTLYAKTFPEEFEEIRKFLEKIQAKLLSLT